MICSQETEIIYAPEGQEWWNDDHFILPIGDRIEYIYIYIYHTHFYIYILKVSLRILEEEERRRSVKWTKKHQGTKKKGEGTWKGKKEV